MSKSKVLKVDSLIVGSNFGSWLLARALSLTGQTVAMVDLQDQLSSDETRAAALFPSLFWDLIGEKDAEDIRGNFSSLKIEVSLEELTLSQTQFTSNVWQQFLGFGETKLASLPLLENWGPGRFFRPTQNIAGVLAELRGSAGVQRLEKEALQSLTWGSPLQVKTRSGFEIEAQKLYWTEAPESLLKWVPEGVFNPKDRKLLARSVAWSMAEVRVSAEVASQIEDQLRWIFTSQDGTEEATLGYWRSGPVIGTAEFVAQIPFLPDREDNEELAADRIRLIRRAFKRAEPGLFESIHRQRVVVIPEVWGPLDLKLNDDLSISGLESTVLASPRVLSGTAGLRATFETTQRAAANVACRTQSSVLDPSTITHP